MSIVGKFVFIKNKESIYDGEWGIVTAENIQDDENFVAIANGKETIPVFSRKELTVPKDQKHYQIISKIKKRIISRSKTAEGGGKTAHRGIRWEQKIFT